MTSTITDEPESTFSTPVDAVTLTSNGHTTTSFPPLVTVMSTSELLNGSYTTLTHVVANPTNVASEGDIASDHSFLHNEGAVAGVFTVVGIIFAALAGCIFVIYRRRRRRASRSRQWLANIQKRLPRNAQEDPDPLAFENPRDAPPVMRSLSQNEQYYHFQSPSPNTARPFLDVGDDSRSPTTANALPSTNALGLTSMEATRASPFSDPYPPASEIGLAVTTTASAHQSRPSLAQSSPSIYPASIGTKRNNQDDDVSVYELTTQHKDQGRPSSYMYPSDDVDGPPTPVSPGPFDDIYGIKPTTAITTTQAPRAIYPQPPAAINIPSAVPSPPPSRPLRSPLRETASSTKLAEQNQSLLVALATPPDSVSGHGHSDEAERSSESPSPTTMNPLEDLFTILAPVQSNQPPAVPVSTPPVSANFSGGQTPKMPRPNSAPKSTSIEDIVTRRTLLDVRPRSSRDNVNVAGRM